MSFGFSIGDFVLLTQLAYTTVSKARKACGEAGSLTHEVNSLHIVLQRLELEVSKSNSILSRSDDSRLTELGTLARDCRRVLSVLSEVLDKYNALSDETRSVTKLWQRIRFGNGEMQDLEKIRSELATYTQAITMYLNLLAMGELGRIGQYMETNGDELREIKHSLHWMVASAQAESHDEKSILTTYAEDDKAVWKEFGRELIKEGFSSETLGRYKSTIKDYVLELGERRALDETQIDVNEPGDKLGLMNDGSSSMKEIYELNDSTQERIKDTAQHRTEPPGLKEEIGSEQCCASYFTSSPSPLPEVESSVAELIQRRIEEIVLNGELTSPINRGNQHTKATNDIPVSLLTLQFINASAWIGVPVYTQILRFQTQVFHHYTLDSFRIGRLVGLPSTTGPTTVSRSAPPRISLRSKTISKNHCESAQVGSLWKIQDLGSSLGTYLNNWRLSAQGANSKWFPVKQDDLISIGAPSKGHDTRIEYSVTIRVDFLCSS